MRLTVSHSMVIPEELEEEVLKNLKFNSETTKWKDRDGSADIVLTAIETDAIAKLLMKHITGERPQGEYLFLLEDLDMIKFCDWHDGLRY